MKCIILCAGYATRLYPLTKDRPKHLLQIRGKTILDHLLARLPLQIIDHIYLVTNDKFYHNFVEWQAQQTYPVPITVFNDHTRSNDDRLGSIGDLNYVFEQANIMDDFLLLNGDNIFNFSLEPMLPLVTAHKNVIALYDVKSVEEARKVGIPTLNRQGVIEQLVEKPENPPSTLGSIGIYFFQKEVIDLVRQYIREGHSTDKVGEFIAWLCQKIDIYTFRYDDPNDLWFDIGTPSQLALAEQLF